MMAKFEITTKTIGNSFNCDICNKDFNSKSNLQIMTKIPYGEREKYI